MTSKWVDRQQGITLRDLSKTVLQTAHPWNMITVPQRQCLIACLFLTMYLDIRVWYAKYKWKETTAEIPKCKTSGRFISQEHVIIATNVTIHSLHILLYTRSYQHAFSLTLQLFTIYNLCGLLLSVSRDNRCLCTHLINMYYTLANTVGVLIKLYTKANLLIWDLHIHLSMQSKLTY